MCKMVDSAIARVLITHYAHMPLGTRINLYNHFFDGRIVENKRTEGGNILVLRDTGIRSYRSHPFTIIWIADRGPCGIIWSHDKECDELLSKWVEAYKVERFEAEANNCMAL